MDAKSLMRKSPKGVLFDAMGKEQASALAARGTPVHYPGRKVIFATGDPGDTLLLIETGRVEISLTSETGKRSILAQLGPSEVVGELAVLDDQPRSADVVAAGDVTGKLLTRAQVKGFLREHPDAALAVIGALCDRLRQTNESFADHVLVDGKTRLARLMLRLMDGWSKTTTDGTRRLETGLSQSDLGDMTGLTRETVNRLIRQWENDGVLQRDGNVVVLLDEDGLHALASGE